MIDDARNAYRRGDKAGDTALLAARRAILSVVETSVEAQSRYRPVPIDTDIAIVRAAENRTEVEAGFDRWEPYTTGRTSVVPVPGTVRTKFFGQNLERLAGELGRLVAASR